MKHNPATWHIETHDPAERTAFSSMGVTQQHSGEEINSNWMSRLVRVSLESGHYYIKTYAARGRGARRILGRSRIRAEWENQRWFEANGIPTARVVAYGESGSGRDYRGVLVAAECPGTLDLVALADMRPELMTDTTWRRGVIHRLAAIVHRMHEAGFVHGDLKWRNILVEAQSGSPEVYLIDCPQGRKLCGPLLDRGIVKDLACLDKVARHRLSVQDRVRFYRAYVSARGKLTPHDRKTLKRIQAFFRGRE